MQKLLLALLSIVLSSTTMTGSEHRVASAATIYLDSLETSWPNHSMSTQTNYDYDSWGRITAIEFWYPKSDSLTQATGYNYSYTYNEPGNGLWANNTFNLNYNNGTTISGETIREYDSEGRLISLMSHNASSYDKSYYDYSKLAQGVRYKIESGEYNSATGEMTPTSHSYYKWSEGANKYIAEYDNALEKQFVYADSVVRYEYNRNTQNLTNIRVYYYADGHEIAYKYCIISYNNEVADSTWYANAYTKEETDATKNTVTLYKVDSKTGVWVPSTKTEQSLGYNKPRTNGYKYEYNWNSDTKTWFKNKEYTFTWTSNSFRRTDTKEITPTTEYNSVSYHYYDTDKGICSATMISSDQFYIIDNDRLANVTYYTYYNTQGTLLRKIKADHKYYYVDQFSELKAGEWIIPTESFYIKNTTGDYLLYIINQDYGFPLGTTSYLLKDGVMTKSYDWTLYSTNSNGRFIAWTKYSETALGGTEVLERGEVNKLSDNLLSCLNNVYKYGAGEYYTEYDIKRGLVYSYYKDSSNTWVYSSATFCSARSTSFFDGDTYITISSTYDRNTDTASTTREDRITGTDEQEGCTWRTYYSYDYDTQEWYKTGTESVTVSDKPEWKTYSTPEVLNFDNPLSPSVYNNTNAYCLSYYDANSRLNPGASSQDKTTVRTTVDRATGVETEIYRDSTEYEITDRVNRCTQVLYNINSGTSISEERYDLNSLGYIVDYTKRTADEEGEWIQNYIHFDYNSDALLVQQVTPTTVYRWAYDQKADLFDNFTFTGVENINANNNVNIKVVGKSVIADCDNVKLTLWSIDGRMADSGCGSVSAQAPGLYIVKADSTVKKVLLK